MPEAPIEAVNADIYPEPVDPFPLHAWIIDHDGQLVAWPSLGDQADIPSNALRYAAEHGTDLPTRGVLAGPPDGWGPGTPDSFLELAGEPAGTGDGGTDLNAMTVVQLRELAATRGIDLAATKKAEIIAEIEAAAAATVTGDGTGDGGGTPTS